MVGFPAASQPLPPTDTSSTNHSLTRKTNQSPCSETTLTNTHTHTHTHTEETGTEGSESQRHLKYGWISTTSRHGSKKKNKTHYTAVAKKTKQNKKRIYFLLSLTRTHRWAWTIIGTSVVVPAIISAKEDERKSYSWNIKAGIPKKFLPLKCCISGNDLKVSVRHPTRYVQPWLC